MAVFTNASLLNREGVHKNLAQFDLAVAKLDVGEDESLRVINRDLPDRNLNTGAIVDSIESLKREVRGKVVLKVMLIDSVDKKSRT